MKLVMAVSKDGYVSRHRADDMSWTGPWDKAAFKLLTMTGDGHLACGKGTQALLPSVLPGRTVHVLERRDSFLNPNDARGLDWFQKNHPNGWLIGGLTIATAAFINDLVDEAHICHSDRFAFPDLRQDPQTSLELNMWLHDRYKEGKPPPFFKVGETKVGDCTVRHWRRIR